MRLSDFPSPRHTWHELWLIVTNPVKDWPLERAMLGDTYSTWTATDYLLASLVDNTNWLVWAKTADGVRGRNLPKPVWRPGMETQAQDDAEVVRRHGDVLSIEEALALQ